MKFYSKSNKFYPHKQSSQTVGLVPCSDTDCIHWLTDCHRGALYSLAVPLFK